MEEGGPSSTSSSSSSKIMQAKLEKLAMKMLKAMQDINIVVADDHDDGNSTVTADQLEERIADHNAKLNHLLRRRAFNRGNLQPLQQPSSTQQHEVSESANFVANGIAKAAERTNLQGMVFGMVLEDNATTVTSSTENMRRWWTDDIRFNQIGPVAISRYNSADYDAADQDSEPVSLSCCRKLMQLPDTILSSLISALMPYCDPPQRKYPLEKGDQPPWWPTGGEVWWPEINALGRPPYKKPHDLNKTWKVGVLAAVIKNLVPDAKKIEDLIRRSRRVQNKLSGKEKDIWYAAIKQEVKLYYHFRDNNVVRETEGAVELPSSSSSVPHATDATADQPVSCIGYQAVPAEGTAAATGDGPARNNHEPSTQEEFEYELQQMNLAKFFNTGFGDPWT